MIILTEVAQKLENILNGNDNEVLLTNPTDYEFVVLTQGFHIDKVADTNSHKNFIPVFVSTMGGQFNPVEGLYQANYTIPVAIYFPVRFKDDFFILQDFLANAFVGRNLNYGTLSGKAISNISVSQFGEIQGLDFKEFSQWVESNYKRPIEVREMWMSMSFTLYLSNAGSGFVFGNDVVSTLSFTKDNETYTDSPAFNQANIQSQSQSVSQQRVGATESESIPFGTTYGSGFSVYVKDNDFYRELIASWFDGTIQTLRITFTITFLSKTFTRLCYVESMNLVMNKGELTTITFAFAKALS